MENSNNNLESESVNGSSLSRKRVRSQTPSTKDSHSDSSTSSGPSPEKRRVRRDSQTEVTDDSDGCGAKFSVLIVSDKFKGKPLLARHRLVNAVLQEELKSIHAFTQKTLTVEQWDAQKS